VTTAIVGPSGSGKSTIIQMIERFYEPKEGEIYFDDVNLKDI
jgi:ABC-type multidrug transport system fused ATPase/permease subunit